MSRYAAIDIGSNSIRLLAAEVVAGEPPRVLAVDRQVVRLGSGVFREGRMSAVAMDTACGVLARMAEEYRRHDVVAVRAVGTAALRDASNQSEFRERASAILGTPIEVISGLEEARLIHLGVQAQWPHPKQRVMILDIGGGSAELILSDEGRMTDAFSKPLGAVRLTEMFLRGDPPDSRELARMRKYIQERLAGPVARFGSQKTDRLIATSSTVAAAVCAVNHVRRSRRDQADRMQATAPQIRQLFSELSAVPASARNQITGIGPRRAEIIVAGIAVLHEVLQTFRLPRVYYSSAGVREGIIADLTNRKAGMEQTRLDADQRRIVRAISKRYGMSGSHVRHVAELAAMLFSGFMNLHRLPLAAGRVLEGAAYLYNIGHFVNEARHHRHALYLVANSDMPGFDDRERLMIANLCRYHRKSSPQASHESFQTLSQDERRIVTLLVPLLRLAVALDQSQEQKVARIETASSADAVEIRLFSGKDVDIEQWHASQIAEMFRQIYGTALAVKVAR